MLSRDVYHCGFLKTAMLAVFLPLEALPADVTPPEALAKALDPTLPIAERVEALEKNVLPPPGPTLGTALDTIATLLDAREPIEVQIAAVKSLDPSDNVAALERFLKAWKGLTPTVRAAIVDAALQRSSWCLELIRAVQQGRLGRAELGARTIYLLRNHEDIEVRDAARRQLEDPRPPRSLPEADATNGNPEPGEVVFEKQCSVCHEFRGRGKDVGPNLTGSGPRGVPALLREIVDPNRAVEASYLSYAVVTTAGEVLAGMIVSENSAEVVLKRNGGVHVIQRTEIATLRSQGISLMPDGMEKTLEKSQLDDLLAFLTANRGPFETTHKALDIRTAANADGSRGLYTAQTSVNEALEFQVYGNVEAAGVPFELLHPASTRGRNLLVLRGGPPTASLGRSYPTHAELICGSAVEQIHFLGAVGGWGFPKTTEKLPVLTVKLHYEGGTTEEHTWRNGIEIVDSHGTSRVPGSKRGLRRGRRQLRVISLRPGRAEILTRIELVSTGGPVAPVVAAVTVELAP